MNLNYSLQQLAKITNGLVIGDKNAIVNQIVIDSRRPILNEKTMFIALKGQKVDGHRYCNSFLSEGGEVVLVEKVQDIESSNQLVVKDAVLALQLIAQYHRSQFNIPVIGITGSNGKTMVKEWLFHTLKSKFIICRSPKSYNSQIGVPLSILELNSSHTLAIFEAGISRPNEMQKLEQMIQPTLGIFTGIGDAHQFNFNSIEEKQNEKFKLFQNVNTLIQSEEEFKKCNIPFNDIASIKNANLVYKTAIALGLNEIEVFDKFRTLPTVSMRLERMQGVNGNVIINDAYTLDDSALEIGISYLNKVSEKNTRDRVVIIASRNDVGLSAESIALLNSNAVDKIVLIGAVENELIKLIAQYSSSIEFIKSNMSFSNSNILITGTREAKLETVVAKYLAKKHITKLSINLSGVANNLEVYRSKIEDKVMVLAMVKAQSYGGGIIEMAQFLETQHINYFGVAYSDEGMMLRENGISTPIIVMNPEASAFDDIIDYKLEPSIYSLDILDQFISALIRKGVEAYPIHLKCDTGMNRLGFVKSDLDELIAQLKAQPEVFVKSVFSHLAVADDPQENEFTKLQIIRFKEFSHILKSNLGYSFIEHIANSAGALNNPNSHLDMIRLGIGLYGLMDNTKGQLEEVLEFETEVSQIKDVSPGDSVGYGRSFYATEPMKVAIIPVGYADGLRRALSNGEWNVLINGVNAPIVGNICMDMCMVDVSNLHGKVGDKVQIFGAENSVMKMAERLHTIPYEIISSISSRVHRVYLGLT